MKRKSLWTAQKEPTFSGRNPLNDLDIYGILNAIIFDGIKFEYFS